MNSRSLRELRIALRDNTPWKRKLRMNKQQQILPEETADLSHTSSSIEEEEASSRRPPTATLKASPLADRKRLSLHASELLPNPSYFSSNHILVNRSRVKRGIPKLHRSTDLDALARVKAQELAENAFLQPSFHVNLMVAMKSDIVGETILRGTDIRTMHVKCMNDLPKHRRHILSRQYNEMGMGTAVSSVDGKLYMVQYFRFNNNSSNNVDQQLMMSVDNTNNSELSSSSVAEDKEEPLIAIQEQALTAMEEQ